MKTIDMEAVAPHSYYDEAGITRTLSPGDRYTLRDINGFPADQMANVFVAQGVAKRIDRSASKASKASK